MWSGACSRTACGSMILGERMSMLAHRLHLKDRLFRGPLRSAELLRVIVHQGVRGACGGTELLVGEVHRLVKLQMQFASLRDDVGELVVEVVDVRFGDAQVRLGERGACRARRGGRATYGGPVTGTGFLFPIPRKYGDPVGPTPVSPRPRKTPVNGGPVQTRTPVNGDGEPP